MLRHGCDEWKSRHRPRAGRKCETTPTTADNYRERSLLMFLWLAALQQQGADTHPFFDIDKKYYQLENAVLSRQGAAREEALREMGKTIDAGFAELEEIQRKLQRGRHDLSSPSPPTPRRLPAGGDMDADWPMFQGNNHNTGYTTAPGPKTGELAWKIPVGLGWYARPVVEDGRVYVASPGMRTTSFCLDLETGKEIWKSTQTHPLFGIYKYPAIMSTPVIAGRPDRAARGQQPRRQRRAGAQPRLPRQEDRQDARAEIRRTRRLPHAGRSGREQREVHGLSVRRARHLRLARRSARISTA